MKQSDQNQPQVQAAPDTEAEATVPSKPANGKNKNKKKKKKNGGNGSSKTLTDKPAGEPSQGSVLHALAEMRHDPEMVRHAFETGAYPYKTKMKRNVYETHKKELQVELLKAQKWVESTGERIVILFEGRDAAGKGGTIKRFMEHLNPRGARVVALTKPTEKEKRNGTSSDTSKTCRRPARSFCSTVPGTTVPVSSGSWVFVRQTSIWNSCANVPSWSACWCVAAFACLSITSR